ncbi:hypothetical protein Zmor_013967 [Zophobas morio]|uniref:Uncharacterized protein n=1 Tax=Zophobas morio TaxID=2755281 RepID=A0AA38IIS6_9CUCU|nr:hypothetical protein Zmor_013967 [Zophobas morio]
MGWHVTASLQYPRDLRPKYTRKCATESLRRTELKKFPKVSLIRTEIGPGEVQPTETECVVSSFLPTDFHNVIIKLLLLRPDEDFKLGQIN